MFKKFVITCIFLSIAVTQIAADDFDIRFIHLIPSDVTEITSDNFLKDTIKSVQLYYKNQLEKHGLASKTFKPELDDKGEILIHEIRSAKTLDYYQYSWIRSNPINDNDNEQLKIHVLVWISIPARLRQAGLVVIFLGGTDSVIYRPEKPLGGVFASNCKSVADTTENCSRFCIVPTDNKNGIEVSLAHELGHSFGLTHTDNFEYLMSHARAPVPDDGDVNDYPLTAGEASFISQNPYLRFKIKDDTTLDADVNFDGYIDHHDIQEVKKGINGESGYDTDINKDGVTNEEDVMIVKLKAIEFIVALSPRKRGFQISTWGAIKND